MAIVAKMKRFLTDEQIRFSYLAKSGLLNLLSDTLFLKLQYKVNEGKEANLDNPTNLAEKFQWYKLNYRDPLMTKCSDKVLVREYVTACGMNEFLNEQYGVYNSFEEIDFESLPEVFYLKCNHGSGSNALIRKKELNENRYNELRREFNGELKKSYFWKNREWSYKNITPKLLCEKCLGMERGPLIDLNFFCFEGKLELIYMNIGLADENGKHSVAHRAIFDNNFNYLEDAHTHMPSLNKTEAVLPPNIERIKEKAELLAKPFPHARVDFFYADNRYYFGEITFYSASGYMYVEPKELYDRLGECFKIPSMNI